QVRLNATTVQNVVTYNTIIDFDNPDLKLFPGMTAYITIPVASASNTIRVPNGALRYKPDLTAEQIHALYQKYGLDDKVNAQVASDNLGTGAAPAVRFVSGCDCCNHASLRFGASTGPGKESQALRLAARGRRR